MSIYMTRDMLKATKARLEDEFGADIRDWPIGVKDFLERIKIVDIVQFHPPSNTGVNNLGKGGK